MQVYVWLKNKIADLFGLYYVEILTWNISSIELNTDLSMFESVRHISLFDEFGFLDTIILHQYNPVLNLFNMITNKRYKHLYKIDDISRVGALLNVNVNLKALYLNVNDNMRNNRIKVQLVQRTKSKEEAILLKLFL